MKWTLALNHFMLMHEHLTPLVKAFFLSSIMAHIVYAE